MKMILIASAIAFLLLLSGCAYNQGVVQHEETAFLKLIGNLENASLQIDDNQVIVIEKPDKDIVYQIKPGTHIITVYKNGEIVVKRELYFDDQITREVTVK